MAKIGLIACSATKLDTDELVPAAELYQGQLFKKARAYVERECDAYFILSALWHVLSPAELNPPYSLYLPKSEPTWQRIWARQVQAQLEDKIEPQDTIVCLASEPY